MVSCCHTVKFNHLADYDPDMISHHRLDGCFIWSRKIRGCAEKGFFKIPVMVIFIVLNISLTKFCYMVIHGLLSRHNYHAAIFSLCLYSFYSYLCVFFSCTFWKLGQSLFYPLHSSLPTTEPLPPTPPLWHVQTSNRHERKVWNNKSKINSSLQYCTLQVL